MADALLAALLFVAVVLSCDGCCIAVMLCNEYLHAVRVDCNGGMLTVLTQRIAALIQRMHMATGHCTEDTGT